MGRIIPSHHPLSFQCGKRVDFELRWTQDARERTVSLLALSEETSDLTESLALKQTKEPAVVEPAEVMLL